MQHQHNHHLVNAADSPAHESSRSLLTHYFDISKPQLDLSSQGSGRPGRTAVTVKMQEPAVSKFMPVVSPHTTGMTHEVVNTWQALKNLATMFTRVNALNKQTPSGPRLFPRSAVALRAAADASNGTPDVSTIIEAAEAQGRRNTWAEVTPSSVLLLPNGQRTAAVADVMNVVRDSHTGDVTLELDLVHDPHTVTEFQPHGKQTLDVDEAHYHFSTHPSVSLDAAAVLDKVQQSGSAFEGLHVFVKGKDDLCYSVSYTPPNGTSVPYPGTPGNEGGQLQVSMDFLVGCIEPLIYLDPGTPVTLTVTGPASFNDTSPASVKTTCAVKKKTKSKKSVTRAGSKTATAYTDDSSSAWYILDVSGAGLVEVAITSIASNAWGDTYTFTVNADPTPPPPPPPPPPSTPILGSIKLEPAKAYRYIDDLITLWATVLDTNGKPMQGAKTVFTWFSDCDMYTSRKSRQQSRVTDAKGQATAEIVSSKPGALAVVAVAIKDGKAVWSEPTHIIYFDNHGYRDKQEQQYYLQAEQQNMDNSKHCKGGADTYAEKAKQMAIAAATELDEVAS